MVVLARDAGALGILHDTLRNRMATGDTLLAGFLTPRSLLPTEPEQRALSERLARLSRLLSDPAFDRASGADAASISRLRGLALARPFVWDDLPGWAKRALTERDGTHGRLAFLYDNVRDADARHAEAFQERYGSFPGLDRRLECFSSSFVYSDLVKVVRENSLRTSLAMGAVLALLLVVSLRGWRPLLASAAAIAAILSWILGTMGLFGIRFGIFNLIVITILQGTLTDVCIYLLMAWKRQGRRDPARLVRTLGSLVAIAVGTTVSGFAGMLFTSHLGIRSIGTFAVLGLGLCVVVSLATLPWLCLRILPPERPDV